MGYNSVADRTEGSPSISIRLAVVAFQMYTKSREISRKFELIAVQGHRRSSILVSMESPYVASY